MVSSVSGTVPFSYFDQLKGVSGALPSKTPPAGPVAPPVKAITKTVTDKTVAAQTDKGSFTERTGLSNEILDLLQGTTAASKAPTTQNSNFSALFGDDNKTSANDILSQIYSNLLSSSTTSTILQIASQNAAAKKTESALQTSPLDKILADYSKAQNYRNEFLKPTVKISS